MANRLARNISGTVDCLNLEGAAVGEAGLARRQIACADCGIGEPQELDICECIGAVAARNPVAYNNIRPGKADDVIADIAGICRGIYSISAIDEVVATASLEVLSGEYLVVASRQRVTEGGAAY